MIGVSLSVLNVVSHCVGMYVFFSRHCLYSRCVFSAWISGSKSMKLCIFGVEEGTAAVLYLV